MVNGAPRLCSVCGKTEVLPGSARCPACRELPGRRLRLGGMGKSPTSAVLVILGALAGIVATVAITRAPSDATPQAPVPQPVLTAETPDAPDPADVVEEEPPEAEPSDLALQPRVPRADETIVTGVELPGPGALKERAQAYAADAEEVLAEFERIEGVLEVGGLNRMRYSELLGDARAAFKRFEVRYAATSFESRPSYQALSVADQAYSAGMDCWAVEPDPIRFVVPRGVRGLILKHFESEVHSELNEFQRSNEELIADLRAGTPDYDGSNFTRLTMEAWRRKCFLLGSAKVAEAREDLTSPR